MACCSYLKAVGLSRGTAVAGKYPKSKKRPASCGTAIIQDSGADLAFEFPTDFVLYKEHLLFFAPAKHTKQK